MTKIIPDHIRLLSPYVPGRLIEDVEAELGFTGIVKLASNENSLGPSPKAVAAMTQVLNQAHRYGDADCRALKKALIDKFDYDLKTLVTGNGSSEFILVLAHAFLGPGLRAVMSKPSFTLYAKNAQAAGAEVVEVPLTSDYRHDLVALRARINDQTRLVMLDNPLNPTGAWIEAGELEQFYRSLPEQTILVIDEAYVDFARQTKVPWSDFLNQPGRLAVLRTFSKAYGLAGLRAAYALMSPELVEVVNKVRQPFNLNSLAQVGAVAALADDDFLRRSLEMTWAGLDFFRQELPALGLQPHPTEANFMMLGLGGRSADKLFQAVLEQGVITRSLTSFGLPGHLRVNAGLPEEGRALVAALSKVL